MFLHDLKGPVEILILQLHLTISFSGTLNV